MGERIDDRLIRPTQKRGSGTFLSHVGSPAIATLLLGYLAAESPRDQEF